MTTATRRKQHPFDPFAIPRFGPYGSIIGARRYWAGLPPPPPHWRSTANVWHHAPTRPPTPEN